MGMSSSQARLLTLTGRLHSIEYKAQKIEAEKLRLANDSDQVYENYLEKMQQTKFVANIMNENGSMTYVNLTANSIYEYGTLQNQYSLIAKKSGKTLIPSSISQKYKDTDSLAAFLESYGLTTAVQQTIVETTPNSDYENQVEDYERRHAAWQQQCANIQQQNAENLAQYNSDVAAYYEGKTNYDSNHAQWERDYAQWELDHPQWETEDPENVKMDQTQEWWVHEDYSMAEEFHAAATSGGGTNGCYGSATGGNTTCYKHILSHIIDYAGGNEASTTTYQTTLGQNTTLGSASGGYCHNNTVTLSDGTTKNSNQIFKEVSEQLNMGIKPNTDGETCDVTASSSDYEKLVSKWNVDGTVKTMKQWAIDLNYVASNASSSSINGFHNAFYESLETFQNELEGSLVKFDEEIYNREVQEWVDREPDPPVEPTFNGTMPTYTEIPLPDEPEKNITAPPTNTTTQIVNHNTFRNKKLAEWYINLWYKMEGLNEVPSIMETVVHDDGTNTDMILYTCESINKSATTYSTNADWNVEENENYIVIPDDKLNDPTWIKNSVAEGYVLIQEFNREENRFNDTSVSVTSRIQEIADEVGLKKAEAEYESDMRKINNKDKYYDTQLAMIEREHEAVKTEIDQLKSVAKENVDRTFKLFT